MVQGDREPYVSHEASHHQNMTRVGEGTWMEWGGVRPVRKGVWGGSPEGFQAFWRMRRGNSTKHTCVMSTESEMARSNVSGKPMYATVLGVSSEPGPEGCRLAQQL